MFKHNVFHIKSSIECHGIWYTLWLYGFDKHTLWTIFVATRMLKRENDAQRAHADWYYDQQR